MKQSLHRLRLMFSAARAVLDNLENQKAFQRAAVSQAEAQRLSALARAVQTRQEHGRQNTLFRGGLAGTAQKLENATADYDATRAAVTASEASSSTFWAVNRAC